MFVFSKYCLYLYSFIFIIIIVTLHVFTCEYIYEDVYPFTSLNPLLYFVSLLRWLPRRQLRKLMPNAVFTVFVYGMLSCYVSFVQFLLDLI